VQPFINWGAWIDLRGSVNLDAEKNYNFIFTDLYLKLSFSFNNELGNKVICMASRLQKYLLT